jgi:hypothetical protein
MSEKRASRAKQVAEKDGCLMEEPAKAQGLKHSIDLIAFAARLKSCPDTKPSQNSFSASFSAACKWKAH